MVNTTAPEDKQDLIFASAWKLERHIQSAHPGSKLAIDENGSLLDFPAMNFIASTVTLLDDYCDEYGTLLDHSAMNPDSIDSLDAN